MEWDGVLLQCEGGRGWLRGGGMCKGLDGFFLGSVACWDRRGMKGGVWLEES